MVTPVEMPDIGFTEFALELIQPMDTALMDGRRTETAAFGHAYWQIVSAQTDFLEDEDVDAMEVFFDLAKRQGGLISIFDPSRPRPRAYGSTPLGTGTATLDSLADPLAPIISAGQAGLEVGAGALVEFRESTLVRSLHRVTEAVTLNGSGTGTLAVTPPVPDVITTGAGKVRFEKPGTLMVLQNPSLPKGWNSRRASFTASEVFPS